jgi:hypothetical protein
MHHAKSCTLILLLTAACEAPLPPVHSSMITSVELIATNPVDVAVMPIEDATAGGAAQLVLDEVRQEIAAQLVGRLYSPIAIAAIDRATPRDASSAGRTHSVVDTAWLATVTGRYGEDAVLGLRITRWDKSSMMVNARVRFAVDATMLGSRDRKILWSGSVEGEVKAGGTGPAPLDPRERELAAGRQLAEQVILLLPKRRP